VGACAKRDLREGETLDGEGGYTVYGVCLPAADSLARQVLPLGLAHGVRLLRPVARGALVTRDDVALDGRSLALSLREEMAARA
jgi:predicted homoserine dehydrogenase-like protein